MLRRVAVGSVVGVASATILVQSYHALGMTPASFPMTSSVVQTLEAPVRGAKLIGSIGAIYLDFWWNFRKRHNPDLDPGEFSRNMDQVHSRGASRLLELLLDLGGIFVKFGQKLSLMVGLIPHQYCTTLAVLQDKVPSLPFNKVEEIFVHQFGNPISFYFSEFDSSPIASASVGQVHRARLKDGREVAVKIQYPKVGYFIHGDILSARILSRIAGAIDDQFRAQEDQFDEWARTTKLELDFIHEAANQERCRKNFETSGMKWVHVPYIVPEVSSRLVLTMEFINGIKITDITGIDSLGVSRSKIAKMIYEAFSVQIFDHGFVHADPHPGNLMIRKHAGNIQMVLLDHGLYSDIPKQFARDLAGIVENIVLNRKSEVKRLCDRNGIKQHEIFASLLMLQSYDAVGGENPFLDIQDDEVFNELMDPSDQDFQEIGKAMQEMSRSIPYSVALVLRNMFMLRGVSQQLGVPINRFVVMARMASKFSASSPDFEESHLTHRVHRSFRAIRFEFVFLAISSSNCFTDSQTGRNPQSDLLLWNFRCS